VADAFHEILRETTQNTLIKKWLVVKLLLKYDKLPK
jgi:hypothetical protein